MEHALIFSDPHLGVSRKANTTRESSKRLQKAVLDPALRLLANYKDKAMPICVGDVFDKFSNNEDILAQGIALCSQCEYVLAGNHDSQRNSKQMSSLDLLSEEVFVTGVAPKIILQSYKLKQEGPFTFVPHAHSQAEFENRLARARPSEKHPKNYLFLHCSYNRNLGADSEGEEASLNLTESLATELLNRGFDRIFLGHEHKPASYLGGKVQVVGNTYPTSFGDISDKRAILLHIDKDELEDVPLYAQHDLHFKGPVSGALSNPKPFMDVVDDFGTEETAKIVRELLSNPTVYAVRVRDTEEEIEMETVDRSRIDSIPEIVRSMIERDKPHLLETYDELVQGRRVQ